MKQRRTVREENFGTRFAFMIIDFFAMTFVYLEPVERRLKEKWKFRHPTFRMLG